MTTIPMHAELTPTVRVTERSDGHFMPFVFGVGLAAVTMVLSLLVTGLPH